jgi:two-component system phosphate regulon sensor histidine kinase PhoR
MRLRHKLLWLLLTTSLVVAVAVGFGAALLIRGALKNNFVERVRAETALLAEWSQELETGDEAQRFAVRAAARLGVRVTLIDDAGVVLADSAKDARGVAEMENHIDRLEVQGARLRGSGESIRRSDTTNVQYFYSACIVEGSGPVKYARIALPASRVAAAQTRYQWLIFGVVLAALLLLATVGYGAVRRLSKPAERMGRIAARIAEGELELEVPHGGRDEVSDLAESVNRMKHSLLGKIDELRREHALLSSVISDMQEGLLVVDPDRRVRLANHAVRVIFDLTFEPTGHLLAEVVRHPPVIEAIDAALSGGVDSRGNVVRLPGSGRSFELHVTPLANEAGVIVLFFDITRLEALEGVRREFVANVSHELRTPLTSIKAFVETLLSGGLQDRENSLKFLEIIGKHGDRMEALIDDITDLSRIETGAVELSIEPLDAAQLAREVVANLAPAIEQNEVKVEIELESPFVVAADRRRIEQVLVNLIENAVKFNRPGGTVCIAGAVVDGRPTIAIEDTGIGIAADNLEKIFHRFYRVDPARSREAGGTGLGLAIVKHLMRLHGGRVEVESELGNGSCFVLEFPAVRDDARRSTA